MPVRSRLRRQSSRLVRPVDGDSWLRSKPRAGWLTNGGNFANQRYSPLSAINRDNVANLRGMWRALLGGSGMGPRSANQAQPIVYDGVLYLVTGDNDAFAIDLGTRLPRRARRAVLGQHRGPRIGAADPPARNTAAPAVAPQQLAN
jgi:hypothetical protein